MSLENTIKATLKTLEREIQEIETLIYQTFYDLEAAEKYQDQDIEVIEQSTTFKVSDKIEQFTTF